MICFHSNTERGKCVGGYELIDSRRFIILSSLLFICVWHFIIKFLMKYKEFWKRKANKKHKSYFEHIFSWKKLVKWLQYRKKGIFYELFLNYRIQNYLYQKYFKCMFSLTMLQSQNNVIAGSNKIIATNSNKGLLNTFLFLNFSVSHIKHYFSRPIAF